MSSNKPSNTQEDSSAASNSAQSRWALPMILAVVAALALGIYALKDSRDSTSDPPAQSQTTTSATPQIPKASPVVQAPTESGIMQVAQAVMVTANLSFPEGVPSIADALSQIERRYEPTDGSGRTFAILDAYGEPSADGKLHISMHVSSEKPGKGSLIFKRTGEVLWQGSIAGSSAAPAKNLTIYVADGAGTSWIVDGSGNPVSVLDAKLRDKDMRVRDLWPDGAEREITFVYSACGCPVKAMVQRVGERTVRTKNLPVLFPDDPAAVQTISRLMRWQA